MVVKRRHFEACISGEFSVLGGVQHQHSPLPMFSSPRRRPATRLPVPTLGRVSPSPWVCPWEGVAGSRGHSAAPAGTRHTVSHSGYTVALPPAAHRGFP